MAILENGKCTGCRACEQICPRHCIHMAADCDGFLYPSIDLAECMECNLCVQHCPGHHHFRNDLQQPKVYAGYLTNDDKLNKSSSGGAFSAIAEHVLKNAGVVCGCELNQEFQAVHVCIDSEQELGRLRGSKYLQSDTRDTFSQTKINLEKGVPVLYTGTPCQIAGLKAFLHKEYENLITIDLVCHGVPSPSFFKKYINWLGQKLHGTIVSYSFRDKVKQGWGCSGKVTYKKGNKTVCRNVSSTLDPYYSLFLKAVGYRQCCYDCAYAVPEREGDFTIGDFWGIEKLYPELPAQKGISLVMVNSRKALSLLPCISNCFALAETTFEQAAAENSQLKHPSEENKNRNVFLSAAQGTGFQPVVDLWNRYYRKELTISRIKYLMPKKFKTIIRKYYEYSDG